MIRGEFSNLAIADYKPAPVWCKIVNLAQPIYVNGQFQIIKFSL